MAVIAGRAGGSSPRTGIILGSGLGGFADAVEDPVAIPYGDLPGFPETGVAGHAGLFGTARDVLTLAGEQMRASAGGASLLEAELVNECWRPPPLPPACRIKWRSMCWSKPSSWAFSSVSATSPWI